MPQFRRSEHLDRIPHLFRPRKHGAVTACEVCGATQWDPIHDVPQRRQDDVSRSPRPR